MNRNRLFAAAALVIALVAAGAWHRTTSSPGAVANAGPDQGLIRQAQPQEILNHVRELHSPVTLINFWASWCEPCKEEFPGILSLRQEYEGKGLKVIFVSVDDVGDATAAADFLKAQQVNFQTFYKGDQPLSFVTQIFPKWTGAVPASVLIGPDLKVLDAWEGDTSKAEFESRIQKLLKGS